MEAWSGQTYEAIMQIPVTRRHRLIVEKNNLEQRRIREHRSAMARARSRRR